MFLQKLKTSKLFEVCIIWASISVAVLFNGALIPLLPIYVEEFNQNNPSTRHSVFPPSNGRTNISSNGTEELHARMNSVITGGLVGLSQFVELSTNFFVGPLADKIGYDVPLFIGYFVMLVTSLGFAFVNSYTTLFVWRALEGIGSAFLCTSGVAIVADMYRDDEIERAKIVGLVMCSYSIGMTVGPPFGTVVNSSGYKFAPFVTITMVTLMLALVKLCIRMPRIAERYFSERTSALKAQLRFIRDPYILMCTLSITLGFIGLSCLQSALPLYMLTELGVESWMTGTAFVPINLTFAFSLPIWVWLATQIGQWPVAFCSFLIGSLAMLGYGFVRNFVGILFLGVPTGIQLAIVTGVLYPIMGSLVNTRIGEAIYGSAFALANIATGFCFGVGPPLAGLLTSFIGFQGTALTTAALTFVALLPAGLLRKPLTSSFQLNARKTLLRSEESSDNGMDGFATTY